MVLSKMIYMKYFTNIAFGCLFIILIINTSCQRTEKLKSPDTFIEHRYEDKVHLLGNDNYPSIQLDIHLSLPEDSITFKELYRKMESCFFDSLYVQGLSTDSLLYILAQSYVTEYEKFQKDLAIDSIDLSGSFNWEIIIKNDIVYKNKNFLSFMIENYGYTGGAHGNTNRKYFVFDLVENKLLTATDVLDLSQCDAIIELQKASLQKAGEDLQNYWLDGLNCDNNFYLEETGLIFFYNQYEIASYAAGPMSIFISFDELKPYLRNQQIIEQLKSN